MTPETYRTWHARFGSAATTRDVTMRWPASTRPLTARSSASPTAASPSTQMTKGSAAGHVAGPLGELREVVDERRFQGRLRHVLRDGHRRAAAPPRARAVREFRRRGRGGYARQYSAAGRATRPPDTWVTAMDPNYMRSPGGRCAEEHTRATASSIYRTHFRARSVQLVSSTLGRRSGLPGSADNHLGSSRADQA